MGNNFFYEQLIALSTHKRLDTEETQEKKMVPNMVNFPTQVTGIRHRDKSDVLDDTVLRDDF